MSLKANLLVLRFNRRGPPGVQCLAQGHWGENGTSTLRLDLIKGSWVSVKLKPSWFGCTVSLHFMSAVGGSGPRFCPCPASDQNRCPTSFLYDPGVKFCWRSSGSL